MSQVRHDRIPLDGLDVPPALFEEGVFKCLDAFVEALHGGEMPVHKVVEQAVQEESDAVPSQVGRGVPSVEYRLPAMATGGPTETAEVPYGDGRSALGGTGRAAR
jgi:hypothetical protein